MISSSPLIYFFNDFAITVYPRFILHVSPSLCNIIRKIFTYDYLKNIAEKEWSPQSPEQLA